MAFNRSEEIIQALRRQLGLTDDLFVAAQIWEKELGALAPAARVVAIKKGVLIVEVASSAHFQELNLRKRSLVEKINQYFGRHKVVKDVRLQVR
jgi:predicted nucleic acid-binding Zn ribbon protein